MINMYEVNETNKMIEQEIWMFVPLHLELVFWIVLMQIYRS